MRPGFSRTTFFLALVVAVSCASYCVLSVADRYYRAHSKVHMYEDELQGWDACRRTRPTVFTANAEAVSYCIDNLSKARENFWVGLPKGQVLGLYALAALGGAAGGCLATWVFLIFGASVIYKSIRSLFRRHISPEAFVAAHIGPESTSPGLYECSKIENEVLS